MKEYIAVLSVRHIIWLVGAIVVMLCASREVQSQPAYVTVTDSPPAVRLLDEQFQNIRHFDVDTTPNAVATNGDLIYTGVFESRSVIAYDLNGVERLRWTTDFPGIQGMTFIDAELVIGGGSNLITFWDAETRTQSRILFVPPVCQNGPEALAFDGRSLWLLCRELIGIDPISGQVNAVIPNAATQCATGYSGLATSQFGELILTCGDGTWFRVSARNGSTIESGTIEMPTFGLAAFVEPRHIGTYVNITASPPSARFLSESFEVVQSFPHNLTDPTGIAANRQHIYVVNAGDASLVAYDFYGEETKRWSLATPASRGLAILNQELLVLGTDRVELYGIDGQILDRALPMPESCVGRATDVAFDGRLLWLACDELTGIDPDHGEVISTFPNPADNCTIKTMTSPAPLRLLVGCEEGFRFEWSADDGRILNLVSDGLDLSRGVYALNNPSFKAPHAWWREPRVPVFGAALFSDYAENQLVPGSKDTADYYFDVYERTGVTVSSWNAIRFAENWPGVYRQLVPELHDRGIVVVGGLSMFTAISKSFPPPEFETLEPAILRDPYGNLVEDDVGTGLPFYLLSSLHPAFHADLLSVLKTYIDAGVEGILLDELAYASLSAPDFNANTMEQFRQYLLETYTSEALQALAARYGLAELDFSTLDYAALARASLPPGRTQILHDEWTYDLYSQIPLFREYWRFLRVTNKALAAQTIAASKAYARENYGKDIIFSANINTLSAPEAFYIVDILDHIDLEFFYFDYGIFPRGRALASIRLAQYFGKPASLLTAFGEEHEFISRGPQRTRNLYRTMIAEAYATGAAFHVEEVLEGIRQDLDTLAPYYRAIRNDPHLFDSMTPAKGRIGLLYLWESIEAYQITDLRGLTQLLADNGYQFGVIFGARDDSTSDTLRMNPPPAYPLKLAELRTYPLMMVPNLSDLLPTHAQILLQYVQDGGQLIVFTEPHWLDELEVRRGSEPAIRQMLDYLRSDAVSSFGMGSITAIRTLWGTPYVQNPNPSLRQPLMRLLSDRGFQPEVIMGRANYVSAYVSQSPERVVVHFVNYDYALDTDETMPVDALDVNVELPPEYADVGVTLHFTTPEREPTPLTWQREGSRLQVQLPTFRVWGILNIERQ